MKKFIKMSLYILCIMLIMTDMFGKIALAADDYVPGTQENPLVIIAAERWMPTFKAGETADLNIPIQNRSNTPATQVKVTVDIGDVKTVPFEIDKMLLTKHVGYLTGTMVVGFKVTVPVNAKPQVYPLNVTVTWSSEQGASGSESATVYVKIENDLKQPVVKLQNIDFKGDRLPGGQASLISLVMLNDSDLPVKDLELKLSGFTAKGINLDRWPDTQFINSMNAGEYKSVQYRLYIDSELESGTHPLDLSVKYKDKNNTEYSKDFKVYIPVSGKGSSNDLNPRAIIDNYSIGGDSASAGKTFTLQLSILNTNQTKSIKNLKVSLNSEGAVFSPVGGSNSFYIADLPPQGRIGKSLNLRPKMNAEIGTHVITATLDYQDDKGTKLTETEIISIPVSQMLQLTTSEVVIPGQVFAQTPTALSLDFYNTGKALIRNLMITTKGDFEIQNGDIFIGNLEAGKDDYYDVTVIPAKEGKVKGVIILDYDNDMGEHFTIEKPFTLTVAKAQEVPMDPGAQQPPTKPNKLPKWLIPAAGGLVFLLILGLAIRHYRKKKQEVTFDE